MIACAKRFAAMTAAHKGIVTDIGHHSARIRHGSYVGFT